MAVVTVRNLPDAVGPEVVHYEAPPSTQVTAEMDRFLAWFGNTRPTVGANALDGIAHNPPCPFNPA